MKIKILFLTFLSILSLEIFAGTPIGGGITYRYIGNKKYEITVKLYRDCRSIPISAPTLLLQCVGGSYKNLTPTRIGITDITPTCKSVGKVCTPSNTTIGGSGFAFEEHTFADTIDFGGSEAAYYSCGTIKLGMGSCCRNGAITTGGAGNDFWVTCTMELGKAKTNSSPVFVYPANLVASCNQALSLSFSARDTIDNDSLSYNFTDPLTSWGGKTTWNGNFSAQEPFTAYWPTGYDRTKGPKPDANPPIGVYLDPETGLMIGTPSDCSEFTIMAVAVKEWRKDSTGKYRQIGEIVRDIGFIVQTSGNNNPAIYGTSLFSICEGEPFSLTIATADKAYVPGPPLKTVLNDTVALSWQSDIKNANIVLDSSYVKQQLAYFTWTPQKSEARTKPYFFTVLGRDNNCPISGLVYKTYKISVYPKIKVSSTVTKLSASDYAQQTNVSNKNYPYFISNNVKTSLPYDTRSFYFKSNKSLVSDTEKDTIVFKKNGVFILNHFFASVIACNTTTISDTINVSGVFDVSVTYNLDTLVCKNAVTHFNAKTNNGKRPITYTWKTTSFTYTDTVGSFDRAFSKNDTVNLSVKDAAGKTNSTYFYVGIKSLPQITAGPDKKACPGLTEVVVARSLKADTLTWKWTNKGTQLSSNDTLKISQPETYIATAMNLRGCVSSDTMKFSNFPLKTVRLLSSQWCQNKNLLTQSEIFSSTSNPNSFQSFQWTLQKTLKKPNGGNNFLNDLLTDKDPSPKYDFNIMIDAGRIDIGTPFIDSLRFAIVAWDSNGCISKSNNTITIIRHPEIDFSFHTQIICRIDTLDLNKTVLTDGTPTWLGVDMSGYDKWPKTGVLPNGIIKSKYFVAAGGKYLVKLNSVYDKCKSSDSIDIDVFPTPVPIVQRTTTVDSVIFTDNSLYVISRKWLLDGVNVGKNQILGLKKSDADAKTLRLELSNTNCFTDTTFIGYSAGIKDLKNDFVKIYPNPAHNQITIDQIKESNTSTYQIYNSVGEMILNGNLESSQTIVNIANFVNGPYIIKVCNEKMTYSFQFMKLD